MKIIVFGLGKMFDIFIKYYDEEKLQILALTDNNEKLHGKEKMGLE